MKLFRIYIALYLGFFSLISASQDQRIEIKDHKTRSNIIGEHIALSKKFINVNRDSASYYARKALNLTESWSSQALECDALYNIGYINFRWGRLNRSHKYLHQSLSLAKNLKDSIRMAIAINRLGNVYWFKDDQLKAKEYFEKARRIYQRSSNNKELGRTKNNLANIYRQWGNYQKAIRLYLEALNHYQKAEYKEGLAWLNFSLTLLYKKLEDYDKALNTINQSLKIYKQIETRDYDSTGIMICYGQLGDIYNLKGNPEKGLQYHKKALRLRKKTGVKSAIADGLTGIGQTYFQMGEYSSAMQYFNRSQQHREEANIQKGMDTNLKFIGLIYYKLGQNNEAMNHLHESLQISRALNQRQLERDILKHMADIHQENREYKKAWNKIHEHVAVKNSLINSRVSKQIASIQLQHQIDQQDQKNERLFKDNEIKELQLARANIMHYLLILLIIFFIVAIIMTLYLYRKKMQIKTLRGLIPICASCKKVRNDAGFYQQVEQYITEHSELKFSHGICPECMQELYPEYTPKKKE
jgi:tetratricopeptide (TPR) repeat protein